MHILTAETRTHYLKNTLFMISSPLTLIPI